MQKDRQVEKIIEYLQGKITNLKSRLKGFESPIMQDMAKNSPYLQMDYIRITSELQANEDNLLAIQKFSHVDAEPEVNKTSKDASDGQGKEES
jgi:hypothetical protein